MPDEWGHESILLLQLSRIPNRATFLFDDLIFPKCSISDFHADIERLHVRRLRSSNGLARLAAATTATLRPPKPAARQLHLLSWASCPSFPDFSFWTVIPRAILGHTALRRMKKDSYVAGKGLAVAGVILCHFVNTLTVLAILFFLFIIGTPIFSPTSRSRKKKQVSQPFKPSLPRKMPFTPSFPMVTTRKSLFSQPSGFTATAGIPAM